MDLNESRWRSSSDIYVLVKDTNGVIMGSAELRGTTSESRYERELDDFEQPHL